MPLDPQVKNLLQQIQQMDLPPLMSLSPAAAREQAASLRGKPLRPHPVQRVENRMIPGPAGSLPIRVYTPETHENTPILVYYHGGGWVLGSLDAVDYTCRLFASGAGCPVVSVDYRLAPEAKFPAAVEDAYAAVCWVAENVQEFANETPGIAVGGDSAGGNLAAAVALMARDRGYPKLTYQLLIYPVTCYDFNTESYQLFNREDYGLNQAEMRWFWQHYLESETDGKNSYASPLLAEDLTGLPPALIVSAEYDVLRDEAEAYAAKLQAAGVSVQLKRYEGMIHSFVGLSAVLNGGKQAITDLTTSIKNRFNLSKGLNLEN